MFADTTYIQTPIDCPDQTIIYREGKKETQIIIKDKIIYLTATTKADSIRFILAYKDSKEFKTITQVKNIVEFKEKTPKWAWYSLGLVFILILWVTRKLWLNLIKFSI
jgi:bacteriorhodopsin